MSEKPSLFSLTPETLKEILVSLGEPAFRAQQILAWIFEHRVASPDAMSNVSKALREKLREAIDWSLPEVSSRIDSEDATTKLLLKTKAGQFMETVVMRYPERTTVCVSSQVGCRLACTFCQTGKLGFFRHLSQHEILSQFLMANELVRSEGRRVSHVVFMGMGEPFDNFAASVGAAEILIGEKTYNLSNRHVTLSTSGIAPKIRELATTSKAALALSLHAANDTLRSELMPINRRHDLAELKDALKFYQETTNRKITIEYILIKDKNCSTTHAKELVRFLEGLRAKVNLIPFNAHPGLPFDRPSTETIEAFQKFLADRSIPAPVRYSRGLDVSAACGQLAAKSLESLHERPQRRNALA